MAKGHGSSQYHKNSQNAKYAKQVKLKLSNKEQRRGSASVKLLHLKVFIIFMNYKV